MVSLKSLKCTGRNFSSCAKQGFWTSSRASLSCGSLAKSPKLYLKNLAGLWIYRRNKSKVTVWRRGKKKPLRKCLSVFIVIQSYQGCEEVLRKSNERGQRACQMEAHAGEERGRRESVLPASNWHATSHHIPHFFHASLFGYHPSCQQQSHTGFAWQTKLVIPGKTGKKFCVIQISLIHQKPWHAMKMVTWSHSRAWGDEHRKGASLTWSKARQALKKSLINDLIMQNLEHDPEFIPGFNTKLTDSI